MDARPKAEVSASRGSIQGQLLRRSEHRAVAIYLRDGSTWVADFVDGRGVLVDVATWFRFNCGKPGNTNASRRIARESAIPLTADLVARIETLHEVRVSKRSRFLVRVVGAIAAVLPRGWLVALVAGRFRRLRSPDA